MAGVVGVQACGLESPVAPVAPNAPTATAAPVPELPEIDIPAPSPPAESPSAPQRPIAVEDGPTFTPFTAAPSITNRQEVIDAMMAEYPPLLREAGIGGTVRVYFFINAAGKVEETRTVTRPSPFGSRSLSHSSGLRGSALEGGEPRCRSCPTSNRSRSRKRPAS